MHIAVALRARRCGKKATCRNRKGTEPNSWELHVQAARERVQRNVMRICTAKVRNLPELVPSFMRPKGSRCSRKGAAGEEMRCGPEKHELEIRVQYITKNSTHSYNLGYLTNL